MNNISDIMKGGISAILIGVGYVLVWCGIFCLILLWKPDYSNSRAFSLVPQTP